MKLKRFFKRLLIRWRKKKYDLRFPVCCKAHGVSFADRQGALAQSRSGDELQLVQVPLENYPQNVYIYSIELNRILGYLEKKSLGQADVRLWKRFLPRRADFGNYGRPALSVFRMQYPNLRNDGNDAALSFGISSTVNKASEQKFFCSDACFILIDYSLAFSSAFRSGNVTITRLIQRSSTLNTRTFICSVLNSKEAPSSGRVPIIPHT